jgi:acetoin:2,6-dichlorophenolindophenol oxidoreductase subunit beta
MQNSAAQKSAAERIISSGDAINEAFAVIGERNKDVLLFAEGIDDPSAMYGTTKNLRPIYGDERIIEMPIAENGLCGVAIGSAMAGKRPVISFHRVEFALLAMEQMVNNAAKMHYVSNGHHTAPIVLRLVIGRGWGQGPEHSQSLESLFSYIPGLKVLMPVFPEDYKGMLIAAIEDNNPVVIIEHRWSHYVKGHVPSGYHKSDITQPKRLIEGKDCTVVGTSFSTLEALKASEALKTIGVNADLFDRQKNRPPPHRRHRLQNPRHRQRNHRPNHRALLQLLKSRPGPYRPPRSPDTQLARLPPRPLPRRTKNCHPHLRHAKNPHR